MKVSLAFLFGICLGRLVDYGHLLFQQTPPTFDQTSQAILAADGTAKSMTSVKRDEIKPENNADNNDADNNNNGWKSIRVFHGSTPPRFPRPPKQKWFGQAKQDQIVIELTRNKKEGFFIDLAANNAITLSNTMALERSYQWKGICVEANPTYWYDLSKYRTCQIFGAVVGGTRDDELEFLFPETKHGTRIDKGVLGGIVGYDNEDNAQREYNFRKEKVRTVTLLEILERAAAPAVIDYFSLDVEGAESLVMKDFPFDEYTVKILTVERPKEDLQALLKEKGYEFVKTISVFDETLWVHSSFKHELDLRSFQNSTTA